MTLARIIIQAGGRTLEVQGCEAACDGRRIRLTTTERALLDLLARHQGSVVPTDSLRAAAQTTRRAAMLRASVPVIVCRLRRKLAWLRVSDLIHTVWDEGYVIRQSFAAPSIRFGEPASTAGRERIK